MKLQYESPEILFNALNAKDIVTTSGGDEEYTDDSPKVSLF